jgi:microsomal dipeptidase-like Zn-dependent dipeptidase
MSGDTNRPSGPGGYVIDGLQYCNWSEEVFRQMRAGGVDAVHATIAYHEDFRETLGNILAWQRMFDRWPDLIVPGRSADDVAAARASGRTAIFFGTQNCKPAEHDLDLIEILHMLGVRFMQLTYNSKCSWATGWVDEGKDEGVTETGRRAIAEMNRVGMVVDMSHSAERSTLEAIEYSARPIAVSHANPSAWRATGRNKSDTVLKALGETGGMLGFSLYPRHLKDDSDCTLESFCEMAARTAEIMGADRLGIGSDLCQGQPDAVVRWMRSGVREDETTPTPDSVKGVGFPDQPAWFRTNADMPNLATGLRGVGFSNVEVAGIMGDNWHRFFAASFAPAGEQPRTAAAAE